VTPTIKDIAQHCHLSISTVSKFLNGGSVRKKNRIAIEEAIRLHNFKVNTIARGLKTKRSYTIGIVVPTLEYSFFGSLVAGIEALLYTKGYSSIVSSFRLGDPELESSKIDFVLGKSVDALVLAPQHTKRLNLEGISVPVVLIDRIIDDYPCDAVVVNNEEVVKTAVVKLIEAGHRRIGLLIGDDNISTFRDRLWGYYKAFDEYGLPIIKENIVFGKYTIDSAYKMMNQLLDLPIRPSSVLATNSSFSVGALISIAEHNLSIPEDISFIGFDCYDLAIVYKPTLTTVVQSTQLICEKVVEILLKRLQENDAAHRECVVIDAEITSGQSIARLG
jgi:DNA-binding LacI/PurR family transcriptional regulator